ncbi:MAG: glutathione S-transferase family protein [Betaproteobacteria bacterium]|jgi:glutathione S-transferase
MKLYLDPITVNCRKIVAGFKLLGTSYEPVKVDYFTQGQKSPEYLAINPNGSLPALVDGDFVLWESNAILQYAADKAGDTTRYPTDLRTRADINRWLLWEANQWFPACYVYLVENVVKPLLQAEPDQAVLDANAPKFHLLAGILEERLSKQPWIAGQDATIADIAVAAPMHLHEHQKLPLEGYPHLRNWLARLEALPCWVESDVRPLLGLQ